MKKSAIVRGFLALCIVLCISLTVCACAKDPENTSDDSSKPTDTSNTDGTKDSDPDTSDTSDTSDSDTSDTSDTTPTAVTYKVTVVDENNAPLAGATVQLCVGDLCRLPSPTDANGVATFEFLPDDYTVKVTLAGYTGEASYTFPADSTELTVQLTQES